MKHFSSLALLTVSSLFLAHGALAQEPVLKANIPFSFAVGNTWMPAGDYTISSPDHLVIKLKSVKTGSVAEVVASPSLRESTPGTSELVFDKYGESYFLHQILCPNDIALNVVVPEGKTEKKTRTLEAGLLNKEETLIAAR
jgi:hypothetical protein